MTRVAVLIVGAIGLGLVVRAALFYSGVDPLAHALVLLIAALLVLGLIELLMRATHLASLSRAIEGLSANPSRAEVDASPLALRTLLGARLSGLPRGVGGAVFTPYLVGLLVMVGLLGTFMGLFETLRGAREALTTSGDVLALREGLAAPMRGLSRAFGTSAAGVSASAMLGLAAVFVRRAEGRFMGKVASLMAGALFPLTIQGRQIAALETLAENRDALPLAAKAIEKATRRLESLEEKLAAQQAQASADASLAFRSAASEIRKDLQSGVTLAAEAVAPLLDRAVVRAAEVASTEMSVWSQKLDADSEARRDEERAHRSELARSSAQVIEAISARSETAMLRDEQRATAITALLESTDAKLADHLALLGTKLAAPLAKAAEATQRGPEAVARLVESERDRLQARESADRARDARFDELLKSLDSISNALAQRSLEQTERVLDLDARLGRERDATALVLSEKLAAHAQGVGESLHATAEMVRDAVGLVHAGGTEMSAVAEMFTGAVDRYCGASEKWLDSLSTIEAAVERKGGGEAVDLLGAYLDQTREVFDHSLAFQRELFTELRALRSRTT